MPHYMELGARVSDGWSPGRSAKVALRHPSKPTEDPMTDERMVLVELLQKSGDGDFLRAVAEAVLQILMEADVEGLIGAGRHERSADRLNYRNGYRDRSLDTRLGPLSLRIPKLRPGSYFPPFLETRKTAERALVTVDSGGRIGGVSTRRVDELVQAMGLAGISKSQVSKLCENIDERVNAFLDRPIDGEWPYLWLDATYLKVRDGGRPHRLGRCDNRRGGHDRRPARDHRPGSRTVRSRTVLVDFSEGPGQAWSQGRQAGDFRCSRRLAPRDHPSARCDMAKVPGSLDALY
jgi:hypothetical protein